MNFIRRTLAAIALMLLITGCNFVGNTLQYRNDIQNFTEAILHEEYDKCLGLLEPKYAANNGIATHKVLISFRKTIMENWGADLHYTFISAQKTFVNTEDKNGPADVTQVQVQFDNGKEYGVLQAYFNDKTHKIADIKVLDIKAPVRSTAVFWLMVVVAVSILVFNIYMLRRIRKRKDIRRKWLKYLAVLFLNYPIVIYNIATGFSINILGVKLLGAGFGYGGYSGSHCDFAIPIAGLYWLWWMQKRQDVKPDPDASTPDAPMPDGIY